ncbi:MAG: radical SAM protein [Treponema sp.]|nr:radical SAM protein [Treponema sp.]
MKNLYKSCRLCPRNCGADRLGGNVGYCKETSALRVAAAVIHRGEEPPLVGKGGSGAIFVSGCNLGCSFCQNYQISQSGNDKPGIGKTISSEEFADICVELRDKGAENINIVTGSHAIPALIDGFTAARKSGVHIPILWNCSAYENTQALELLGDYISIFLPDLKTLDSKIAGIFFNAPDYPDIATAAIQKMIDITQGIKSRIIIRHLVLPGYLDSTRSVLHWFADNTKSAAMLSLMTQYTPIPGRIDNSGEKPMPQRYLSREEHETVLYWLREFDIEDGFCQELVTGSDWLPDFRRSNPFSSELSVPIWP